ncbi:MAG TPA: TadA family conjugal transfer-associated ATPase [Actinomycetes bacterium]
MTVEAVLVERVRARLARAGEPPSPARVAAALRAEGAVLGDRAVLEVVAAVQSELAGTGVLDPLLRDPAVTDVLVNGPREVWVDRGGGLEPAAVRFRDEVAVRALAQRLAAAAGRRLDTAQPMVDARLPGGVRLHAVLPPVASAGTLISLRVARPRAFTLDELVAAGSLPAEMADLLRRVVAARLALLVTGGTGSGKTTLLSTLLGLVPAYERIVLVEDSGELVPDHPHVVRLEARRPNVEGAGAVELRDLVRQALRMRPDRLVVGEVRGAEVVDLLSALNTGHDGGCGTVHANSAGAVPARLEALALAAGLGRAALHSQLAAAVQAVVHLARDRSGRRRVTEVSALDRDGEGRVVVRAALSGSPDGSVQEGPGAPLLADRLSAASGGA